MAGVAEALRAIHAAGVVHRDLKPSNVLLAPDGPRVIDFGIAWAAEATTVTRTGIRVGSPQFMAPEQISGLAVAPAIDVFSLGSLAAFAATAAGLRPGQHGRGAVPGAAPADLRDCPPPLRGLVERYLAKQPTERPTVAAVVTEARRLAAGQGLQVSQSWLPAGVAAALSPARPASAASAAAPATATPGRAPVGPAATTTAATAGRKAARSASARTVPVSPTAARPAPASATSPSAGPVGPASAVSAPASPAPQAPQQPAPHPAAPPQNAPYQPARYQAPPQPAAPHPGWAAAQGAQQGPPPAAPYPQPRPSAPYPGSPYGRKAGIHRPAAPTPADRPGRHPAARPAHRDDHRDHRRRARAGPGRRHPVVQQPARQARQHPAPRSARRPPSAPITAAPVPQARP